jgi:separase
MALAECSRIALAALKKYGPLESTKPGSSTSMLDAAASHLISKLIALGMEDLAVKELRLLAGRLVKSKDRRETAAHDSGSTEAGKCETVSSGQQNLTDLLDFSGVASEFHNLDLIVTTQIQIIKIIASRRRPSSIEAALEHLRLSALYSPVNLIERGMKDQMKDTRNKAARQLEVLCQAIIMLLPSSSASGGCETIDPRKWPSPQVVLRYQHLILEIRQKLWSLSEHQIDLHKELISPFKKSLEVFIQRSGPPTLKILIRAKEATTSFAALVESVPIKLPIIHAIDLQRPLAVLACSLGQFDDAIQIFTRCQELSNSSASKARLCALSCQISSASLQKLAQLHEIELSVIQDTITLLKAEFQGNSEELDDLLVCASSLRKPATTLLTQGAKGGDGDIAPVSIDLQQACLEVLLAAVSFLKRYVGKDPLSTHESNAGLRYKQRTRLALAVIRPMIDSLASLSRLPLLNLDRAWRNLDLALQDCYSLCLDLQHSEAWNELPPNGTLPKNYFVLLSNAYWCCYLTKKAKSEPSQLRYLISKSISIIAERSPEEKEAGYLSIKLEKLGMLQESSGKWAESLGHYRKALKFELEAGILQSAAQSAASYPLSAALADTGRAGVFVRLLSAFLKVSQKIDNAEIDQPVVFDDDQVSDVQRGLLFEHQLESLVSLPGNAELPDRFWQTLTMLSNTLLQIYSKEKFPIRRLRVVVRLLHVYSTNRPILGSRFLDKLLETQACCTLPELGNDQGLQRYASNLLDRQILLSAVGRELVDVQALHKILGQWVRLVLSLPDWTTLQNKVDNPKDWISELHFLGEYLRMKGQEELCASVLQIVSRIHSLQFSTINAIQISNLSNLGLQLTRLGHTEEAGRILQKANGHIDDCDIPSTTLIRLHLAYAEYLLAIGNTVRW